MYYGDQRKAKVNLSTALRTKGWEIFGYKADESDSMTDYYSPAYWDGIATKNGLTLVVDVYSNSYSGKEVYKTEYIADTKLIGEKIEKVTALYERGATEGERESARVQLVKLESRKLQELDKVEKSKVLVCKYPEYQPHPTKRTKWHLEKDGVILASGCSLYNLYYLPDYYDLSTMSINRKYHERYRQWETNYSTGETVKIYTDEKIEEFYTPNKDQQKAINLLEKIVSTVEKHAKEFETVVVSDGTEEGEKEGLKQSENNGYKKVTKTRIKKIMKAIELPEVTDMSQAEYFMLKVNFNYGCHKGYVYKISSSQWGQSQRLNGKLTKVLTGTSNQANTFTGNVDSLNKWLAKGSIVAVKVVEVEEVEEYEALEKVKAEPKKSTKKAKEDIEQSKETDIDVDIQIVFNEEKSGIELIFNDKPSEEIRTQLKENGFRWHRVRKIWYAKDTEERRDFVKSLLSSNDTEQSDINSGIDTSPESAKLQADIVDIIHNKQMEGIEIYFSSSPSSEQLKTFRQHQFRYHKAKNMCYTKYSKDKMDFAEQLRAG